MKAVLVRVRFSKAVLDELDAARRLYRVSRAGVVRALVAIGLAGGAPAQSGIMRPLLDADVVRRGLRPSHEGSAAKRAAKDLRSAKAALRRRLARRNLLLSDDERARIWKCKDVKTIQTWLGRAQSAPSVAEVLLEAPTKKCSTSR